jgi:hypothetical protein
MRSVFIILLAASVAHAKPAEFASRVQYEPLLAKLQSSGGSLERVLRVERAAQLDALESGRRYKFAVEKNGRLAIAPLRADAPNNEYVHPILARGAPVLTAGGIRIDRSDGKLTRVVLDQDSKSYCPTLESLATAARALEALGILPSLISREDRPPKCA